MSQSKDVYALHIFLTQTYACALTCVGDGEAVGRLYIVDVWDQVKRGFRGIWAGVVKKDS